MDSDLRASKAEQGSRQIAGKDDADHPGDGNKVSFAPQARRHSDEGNGNGGAMPRWKSGVEALHRTSEMGHKDSNAQRFRRYSNEENEQGRRNSSRKNVVTTSLCSSGRQDIDDVLQAPGGFEKVSYECTNEQRRSNDDTSKPIIQCGASSQRKANDAVCMSERDESKRARRISWTNDGDSN